MIDDDRIRAARERRLAQAEAEGDTDRAKRLKKALGKTAKKVAPEPEKKAEPKADAAKADTAKASTTEGKN